MSGYRGHPRDTDNRPIFRHTTHMGDRDRPLRGPPAADRSDLRQRSSAGWPPPFPASSDWDNRFRSASSDWDNRPRSTSSDWDSRPRSTSHWSQDGALSVLSSCGLDARDLSMLAELPEDMLTLKSLPQVLSQMKQKKDPYLPTGLGPMPHIDQSQGPSSRPLDRGPGLYREPLSSQSTYVVDYGHRASDVDYCRSRSPHGSADRRRHLEQRKPPSVPTETEARDFQGTKPDYFPYSCSLCDITVLSENVWSQHINTSLHADKQLDLLQKYPKWDCRLDSARRDGKKPVRPEKKSKKDMTPKAKKKGKVVCVKFASRSVDEAYLRNLLKDFGQIMNIALFPSLGFIELESPERTEDLLSFFTQKPHKVNDETIEFSISTTFNFFQSSFVLNFFPVPFGNDGKADLMAIIKRFGTPLYTMFITDTMHAYVEMQNAADAHKMVEYYSTTQMKMNGVNIVVSFSQEFRTLARCAKARPYEETEETKPEKEGNKKKEAKKEAAASESQKGSEAQSVQTGSEGQTTDEPGLSTEAEPEQTQHKHEQSEEGSDMEGAEVIGASLDDDEEIDLDNCITLDEVCDAEEPAAEGPQEEKDDLSSPRVVYIGNLPLCRFSDPQFIKMVQLVHRPVKYFINRPQRMGLAEFASEAQAREFVSKMQDYCFGGCNLTTFISNKYTRLPWGRGVEYDKNGRIMRHFKIGELPRMTTSRRDRNSPKSKHGEKSRDRPGGKSRGRSRSKGKSSGRSKSRPKSKSRAKSKSREKSRRSRSREKSKDRERSKTKECEASLEAVTQAPNSEIEITNVVSLKMDDFNAQNPGDHTLGEEGGAAQTFSNGTEEDMTRAEGNDTLEEKDLCQEEGWAVANLETDEPLLTRDTEEGDEEQGAAERKAAGDTEEADEEQGAAERKAAGDAEADGEQGAAKRKAAGDAEAEGREEKKRKDQAGEDETDTKTSEGGDAKARVPSKPVGTEFIRFYCALCHVMYQEEQEATTHCSTIQHYLKYEEMTGKDPWSAKQ